MKHKGLWMRTVGIVLVSVLMVLAIVPTGVSFAATAGVVTSGTLNVRSGAGTSYSVVGTLYKGDAVSILAESNGWAQITSKTYNGYVSLQYIQKQSAGGLTDMNTTGTVNTAGLRMRSEPSSTATVIGSLPNGAKITISGKTGDWYKATYDGRTGYVSSQYVTLASGSNTAPSASGGSQPTATGMGTITSTSLLVRSGAGSGYDIIGILRLGNTVPIYGKTNGWYKVIHLGLTGYINAEYVNYLANSASDPTPVGTPQASPQPAGGTVPTADQTKAGTGIVKANSLNVRTGPGTNYSVAFSLPQGTTVAVGQPSNGWVPITHNNRGGYVNADYLTITLSTDPTAPANPTAPTGPASPIDSNAPSNGPVSVPSVQAPANSNRLAGKVIYLDAGHGGTDPGAYYGGIYEKTINLQVAERLRTYLINQGATVIMIRPDDSTTMTDLSVRASVVNAHALGQLLTKYGAELSRIDARIVELGNLITAANSGTKPADAITFTPEGYAAYLDQAVTANTALQGTLQNLRSMMASCDTNLLVEAGDRSRAYLPANAPDLVGLSLRALLLNERIQTITPDGRTLMPDKASFDAQVKAMLQAFGSYTPQDFLDLNAAKTRYQVANGTMSAVELNTQYANAQTQATQLRAKINDISSLQAKLDAIKFGGVTTTMYSGRTNPSSTALKQVFAYETEVFDDCIFISLHCNATEDGKGSKSGTEVYYVDNATNAVYFNTYHKVDQRKRLAELVATQMANSQVGLARRGVLTSQSFAVCRETNLASILLEMGYLDNETDRAKLASVNGQENIATALTSAILEYFGK